MDVELRKLERNWEINPNISNYQKLINAYQRLGQDPITWPHSLLDYHTQYNLQNQPFENFALLLKERGRRDGRLFEPFLFSVFCLSIQASSTHYCMPRRTLDDPLEYYEWEVAIFDSRRTSHYGSPLLISPQKSLSKNTGDIEFQSPTGLLHGMPQQNIFSIDGLIPYGPTAAIQEIYDFFRARFTF